MDLSWLTGLLDEGAKPVAVLATSLCVVLLRHIKTLHDKLLERAEREREQQNKINEHLGQDSRLISEFITATRTIQKWQAASAEPRRDA